MHLVDARTGQMRWQELRREFLAGRCTWDEFYNAYLDSSEWRSTREKILKRDGYKCRLKHRHPGPFQVHHANYDNLKENGKEEPLDLLTLCVQCHEMVTEDSRNDYYR